jgi:hypothetical protein
MSTPGTGGERLLSILLLEVEDFEGCGGSGKDFEGCGPWWFRKELLGTEFK